MAAETGSDRRDSPRVPMRFRVRSSGSDAAWTEHEGDLTIPWAEAEGRLAIVIDEFAAMAKELPDFVAGLIGIAQRGRSLGVHLVMATQRPSGVISRPACATRTALSRCIARCSRSFACTSLSGWSRMRT